MGGKSGSTYAIMLTAASFLVCTYSANQWVCARGAFECTPAFIIWNPCTAWLLALASSWDLVSQPFFVNQERQRTVDFYAAGHNFSMALRSTFLQKKRRAGSRHVVLFSGWPQHLRDLAMAEVAHWAKLAANMRTTSSFGSAGHWCCPMCPVREFKRQAQLQHHLARYHVSMLNLIQEGRMLSAKKRWAQSSHHLTEWVLSIAHVKNVSIITQKLQKVVSRLDDNQTITQSHAAITGLPASEVEKFPLHASAAIMEQQLRASPF